MKHLFCKWLAAMLIAGLMLSGAALMEESDGAVEAVAELEEITVEPVEDVEAPVGEEALVDFVEEAAEPETEDGDEAEEPDVEAVEAALPEPVTDEAADAILEESAAEAPEAVEEQADEAAKLMEGEELIPIDEAHFPDAAFRQLILVNCDGKNGEKDGCLSQSERELVEHIGGIGIKIVEINSANGKPTWTAGITSLQGVAFFPNLREIDCTGNPIASLDVSGMKKLERLACEFCGMTSLNVSGCDNLNSLWLKSNKLTAVDVSSCPSFAGFPKSFQKMTDSKSSFSLYMKRNGYGNLEFDKKVKIITKAGAVAPAVPAGAVEVPGAATATVTVAANSTAKRTIMTAVAAPGAKMQLDLGGATGKKFKSSKKKVAGVNKNGVITFKKAGKTKITYKVGKKKRTVVLTVVDPTLPTSVSIDPVATDVKKGDTVTLNATLPEGTASTIKWKTSNKKVAAVNNGVVRFKKAGRVTITAITKRGKKKASVTFNVSK